MSSSRKENAASSRRDAKNAQKVREYLSCFFASDLIWGLGRFHESFRRAMVQESSGGFYRLLAVDALVSLAQAIGVLPVTSVEHQGAGCYYDELNVNADQVLQSIESCARD